MGTLIWIVSGILIVTVVLYFIGIYNQLIQIFVNVDKSWSNIMVLEKQRYDEIPKLVEVCNGYMKYERETLEKVTLARTKFLGATTPPQVAQAGADLSTALKSLFAVSENYPDLKANNNFRQLQERISYLENQIADRREFYNDSVAIFNSRIKQIPDTFVANMMNYQSKEMYKVAESEKQPQSLKFDLPK
ncbi:MAG: LemA family protein [Elusimicrobia bacterium]|nr:LemA family protein [Elusimicrobiota bacterium]